MEYTFSLALVDFLPVVFTSVGLYFVVRMVTHIDSGQGNIAALGAVLTVAGGFFKATWKLFMAFSNGSVDIRWMEEGLFVWMAPGYTLLLWGVFQTVRTVQKKRTFHVWMAPALFIILMFAGSVYLYTSQPDSSAWERVLLSVMVLATTVTGILLAAFGFRQKIPMAGWLFILNLVGVFLLNGLARVGDQTIALQWIEEGINTVSWLVFAYAAYLIHEYTRVNFGVDALRNARTVAA